MTWKKFVRRSWLGLVAQPRNEEKIRIPYFREIEDEEGRYEVLFRTVKKKGVDIGEIAKKQEKFRRQYRTGDIRIESIPTSSVTVDDIERYLDNMEYYEKFIADIVVVDYADIVASDKDRWEYRHSIDRIWKGLRRLCTDRNVLLITASQAGRAASKKDATEGEIAEDIRKIAHVDKMIAINMNKKDRERQAVRIAQLAEREGIPNYKQALVLHCLQIGRPYIDSRYVDDVEE